MKNVIGEQVAWYQKKKQLHILLEFFVKSDRFVYDPVADQKAELFIKTQKIGQHKGDNEYQYIYYKANDI